MIADLSSDDDFARQMAEKYFSAMPAIEPDSEFTYQAFELLKRDRPATMGGEGYIPFTAIVKFAKFYELDQYHSDQLVYLITTLDAHELNLRAAKRARENAKKPKR